MISALVPLSAALQLLLQPGLSAAPQPALVEPTEQVFLQLLDIEHLPVSPLLEQLGPIEVAFHDGTELPLAWLQPGVWSSAGESGRVTRLQAPRIWLASRAFSDEKIEIGAVPPDSVEQIFFVLTLARLQAEIDGVGPLLGELSARVGARSPTPEGASALAPDTAEQVQPAAVAEAYASFVSHVVSGANEIERAYRRQRQMGKGSVTFCELLRANAGLFAIWRRAWQDPEFLADSFQGGARILMRLDVDERRWLGASLLEDVWSGEPRHDFEERYCR